MLCGDVLRATESSATESAPSRVCGNGSAVGGDAVCGNGAPDDVEQ
jgi:hypothetical protein